MVIDSSNEGQERVTAILCSGGLDSAVLVAHEATMGIVQPVYIQCGFAWEPFEQEALRRLLEAPAFTERVRPIAVLDNPIGNIYPNTHWALRGIPPGYNTPDADVYLIGRNVLLLSKIGVYCALHCIQRIAMGPLKGNPFPDATPNFFESMGNTLSLGLDYQIDIIAPFASLNKAEVIERGIALSLPLELTLSCMHPDRFSHCGHCSKCRERLQAFKKAGLRDPANYAFRPKDIMTGH